MADDDVIKLQVIMDVTKMVQNSNSFDLNKIYNLKGFTYQLNGDHVDSSLGKYVAWTLLQQLAQIWAKSFHEDFG